MKKITLLFAAFFATASAFSQVTLTVGPSSSQTRKVDSIWKTTDSIKFSINGTNYGFPSATGGGGSGLTESKEYTKIINWATPDANVNATQLRGYSSLNYQGTGGTVTIANTSTLASIPRVKYTSAGTATAERTGLRSGNFYWLGNAAGLGGFDLILKASFPLQSTDRQIYMGLMGGTAGFAGNNPPSGLTNALGVGVDATDVNWQIMFNDASGTCTKVDTGIPVTTSDGYSVRIVAAANASSVNFIFKSTNGTSYTYTATTNLPDNGTFLEWIIQNQTNASTTIAETDFMGMYVEAGANF